MSFSHNKFKRAFPFMLVSLLILLSGCGLTVTKVESTTVTVALTTEGTTVEADKTEKQNATKKAESTTEKSTARTVEKTKKETPTALTSAETTKATDAAQQAKNVTCTIEIECKKILENAEKLRPEKQAFLPSDGYILKKTSVTVKEGSSAFEVLKKVCGENVCPSKCQYCKKSGIQLEYIYSPQYDSEYVRGIHQLYEKDCGTRSGWMYSVNGAFPNYGVNKYIVKNGDVIQFRYTCDLGEDF